MNARPRPVALAAIWAATVCALPVQAHDTWFASLPADARGSVALALGTGNRFPVHESGIGMQYLLHSGCRGELGSAPLTLQRTADAPTALKLRVRADRDQPLTCWAQTSSFDVELADALIAPYFKEIQPPTAVREAWAQMRARGVKWKERYTKHARIELNPGASAAAPVNMALDVLLEAPQRTPKRGDTLQFRVLRNGQPLPDFAVELRGDQLPIGAWRKTDAEGRVRFPAPLPGRWVLRGTDLRLSEREPDTWESRFVTLAFEIAADQPRAQADINASPNARSTNQTAAISTISSEPPNITQRR
ncbi:MAG: DUF4198 domain-containing protein [Burkholderiaceae bacterium]|nr:DUF4198 domain-containing protein [Burkholderiaceae bacterium]